jgi:DNA-binding response OmpR family regulator
VSDGAQVLIVDDEREFATTLAERLSLRGYDASAAFSAEEALAVVAASAPDVVLLDLTLPGVRGVELLMTLRQLLPQGEIILLSGHLDLAEKIEGVRIDAFGMLLKPVVMAELTGKIDAALARRKTHAAR